MATPSPTPLDTPALVDASPVFAPPTLRRPPRPRRHAAPVRKMHAETGRPVWPVQAAPRELPATYAGPDSDFPWARKGYWTLVPEAPEEKTATVAGDLRQLRATRLGLREEQASTVELAMHWTGPGLALIPDDMDMESIRSAASLEAEHPVQLWTRVFPPVIKCELEPRPAAAIAAPRAAPRAAAAAVAEEEPPVTSPGTTPPGAARAPSPSVEDCTTPVRRPSLPATEPATEPAQLRPGEQPACSAGGEVVAPATSTAKVGNRGEHGEAATHGEPSAAEKKKKKHRRSHKKKQQTAAADATPSPSSAASNPEGLATIVRELCRHAVPDFADVPEIRDFAPRTAPTAHARAVGEAIAVRLGEPATGSSHVPLLVGAVAIVEHALTAVARDESSDMRLVVEALSAGAVACASVASSNDDEQLPCIVTALGSIVATVAASALADADAPSEVCDAHRRVFLVRQATRMLRDAPNVQCAPADAAEKLCAAEAATRLLQCAIAVADPKYTGAPDDAVVSTRHRCRIHAGRVTHLGADAFVAAVAAAVESGDAAPLDAAPLLDGRDRGASASTPSLPGYTAALQIRDTAKDFIGRDGHPVFAVPWFARLVGAIGGEDDLGSVPLAELRRKCQTLAIAVQAEIANPTVPPSHCMDGPSVAALAASAACLVLVAADVVANGRIDEGPRNSIAVQAALRFRVAVGKLCKLPRSGGTVYVIASCRMLLNASKVAEAITEDSRVACSEEIIDQLVDALASIFPTGLPEDTYPPKIHELVEAVCLGLSSSPEKKNSDQQPRTGHDVDDDDDDDAPKSACSAAA